MLDQHKFKFIFYASFPKREDTLGLELCEGLDRISRLDNDWLFKYHLRVSEDKTQPRVRWDFAFIEE